MTDRLERPVGPLAKIEDDIIAMVEALGFDMVRMIVIGSAKPRLQLMAEPLSGDIMTVEGCQQISQALSAYLDVEDPIKEEFTLEVSSPGVDRPLTRMRDFARFVGFQVKAETRFPVEGRRRFNGKLAGAEDGSIQLVTDEDENISLPFVDLAKAKLVATDELFEIARTGKLPKPLPLNDAANAEESR